MRLRLHVKDVPIKEGGGKEWAWLERYMIPCYVGDWHGTEGRVEIEYLRRLRIVQTPWFGVYLHDVYEPDSDRHLHDHPWSFISVVLRGWYKEYREDTRTPDPGRTVTVRRRFSVSLFRLDQCHKIFHCDPNTVTLLLVGPRRRKWGFYTEDGWVPFNEYKGL